MVDHHRRAGMPWVTVGEAAAQVVEGVRERLEDTPDLLRAGVREPANNTPRGARSAGVERTENEIPKSPGGCRSRAAGKSGGNVAMKGDLAGKDIGKPGKLGRAGARIW
jgi:hypothetical protein